VGNLILDEAESIAERHGAKGAERLMRYGEAAKTILQAADDLDANIIVMGSRGMSDLKGLLVGSVSHKVSNLADCTCVSVK
ncbi:MAG: universal stress protein, partial [Rhodospirillales bacterium]|jgi:nucleotide-binding universal stress UspA family protein|nr:universal stress protein [Rhodospirillales bacterium]